jgi:O-antigen/teichoic acid export membrane protein
MPYQVILTVISGELKGKQLIFDQTSSYTIGRAQNCNLCFPDDDSHSGISRYHCLLEIDPPHVQIRDLGSTNGTLVNGQLLGETDFEGNSLLDSVNSHTNYPLKSGDEINIGDTILKVEIISPEPPPQLPPQTSESKTPSLKSLAIKGVSWTVIGYGATQVLRFGSNIILTRLLEPKIFGLMSIVTIFLISIQLFSDFGINQSIIRHRRGEEPVFLNTAWTVQVVRGICIWLVYLIIAWPLSLIYNQPDLMWLIPFAGLNAIILGFHSTIFAKFSRHVSVDRVTIINISVYIIQIFVTLTLTLFYRSIWPLVVGSLLSSLFKLFIGHWLNRKSPNRFAWDRDALKELFSFGKWVFIATMIGFLAAQSDVVILGKLAPLEKVGVYNIAFTLSDIPRQIINGIYTSVIYPLVSKLINLPKLVFRQKFADQRRYLLIPCAIVIAMLANFGDLVISLFYDNRYYDARWMIPILSLGLWHTLLYRTTSSCLVAMGKPFYVAQGNFLRFLIVAMGLPIVFSWQGLFGAVVLMSFSDLPVYASVSYGLWREKLSFWSDDIKMSLFFFAVTVVLFGGRMYLGSESPLIELLF